MYKFRNTSIEETNSELRTNLQAQFSAMLKVSLQVSDIILLIFTLIFGHLVKVRVRKIGVLCTIFVLFVALTAFVKIDTDSCKCFSVGSTTVLFFRSRANTLLRGGYVDGGWN